MFLQTFHQARISQSAKLVEDELWNPAEVTLALQRIADVLIDAAVRDSSDLILSSGSPTPTPTPAPAAPPPTNGTLSPPRTKTNGSSAPKHIRIEDRTYFIVSATADVLGLLMDYLKVIVNLSMLTTDTMSRVIEFLKAFNSRTCQVVLGAGAMRSAGLKNITAKHLGAWLQLIVKLWCFFFSGLWLTKFTACPTGCVNSFSITVAFHNDRTDPLRAGNIPTSSESEAGRNVGGI